MQFIEAIKRLGLFLQIISLAAADPGVTARLRDEHLVHARAPDSRRVLLVEDDGATAELVRRTLVRSGFSVEIAPAWTPG
jgi:hypothetical protein